jgi:putative transposase
MKQTVNFENLPQRKTIRLKGYDYSRAGLYFITICTQDRLCLFGKIENGLMILNDAGHRVNQWWDELKNKYNFIELHEQIIMPNHFHGIIQIFSTDPNGQTHRSAPTVNSIVQWFKTMTTNGYIRGVKNYGWPRFHKKLWQRNYYEHIIRDEISYHQISEYIQTNSLKWGDDTYYAEN